jgi:hypothetical protein
MDTNQQNTPGQSQTGGDVMEALSSLKDSAAPKLNEIIEPVKEQATKVAQEQKDAGADQLGIVARAIHGAACELEGDMPQLARYVHDAGQQIDDAASGLRSGNINDLMDRFGTLARNQPAMVFGGAVVAGFALTRFLKASAQPPAGAGDTQGVAT